MITTTTFRQLLRDCEMLDWRNASDDVIQNARRVVDLIGSHTSPVDITTDRIDRMVAMLQANGLSSSRIRALLSALRVMLNRAQRQGLIIHLPLFPEGRTLPVAEPRDLVLQPMWCDQLKHQLVEAGHIEDVHLVQLLLNTGLRVSEAMGLTWERISLQDRCPVLSIVNTKTHKPRRVPLNDAAVAALLLQRTHTGRSTGPVWDLKLRTFQLHHKHAIERTCQALHLGEEIQAQWCVHTYRHTCLSRLASLGWSAFQIQALAGHASITTSQRYVHAAGVALPQLPATM